MTSKERRRPAGSTTKRLLTPEQARMWRIYIRVLLRLSYEMNRELQIDTGISLADYHVLNALAGAIENRMTISAIATRIGWERSRTSHHAKRMSARGLVDLRQAPTDGRATEVTLTPAGQQAYSDANPGHMAVVKRLFVESIDGALVGPLTQALEGVYETLIERGSLPRPEFPPGDNVGRGPTPSNK